jgi:hypothetical protein
MSNIQNLSTVTGPVIKARRWIIASLVTGALALPFLMSAPRAQAHGDHREHSRDPLGSWIVQIALDPKTVPPGTPLSFMALYTFSEGGGYVQSNTGPGAGGPPAYGNWERAGDDHVSATALRFGFDADHHFTGLNKIREHFTFTDRGDEFTGSVQVDVFLPDGTLLPVHPAGTYQGTRVEIEPVK